MPERDAEPAFRIGVADADLKRLGEISVIQGHVEAVMACTVARLLDVPMDLARAIMGSTRVLTNFEIWRDTIHAKPHRGELGELANQAFTLAKTLATGRNDFVHGVYVHLIEEPTGTIPGLVLADEPDVPDVPIAAYRSRDPARQRGVEGIRDVRRLAAKLSRLVAHIDALVRDPDAPTPWQNRL